MKKLSKWRILVIFLCALPLLTAPLASVAQSATAKSVTAPDALFQTISALDTKLFDAYNHCDLDTLGAMVADDLEFYHDKTGLSVGKQVFLDAIRNNICGKVHRTLVPGTLEVYPLNGYGAVEIGVHRFTHPGIDDDRGEAKFVTIWQKKDGSWKITRAISYDHGPVKQ
jgi:ketosteroid isomerase-like protein